MLPGARAGDPHVEHLVPGGRDALAHRLRRRSATRRARRSARRQMTATLMGPASAVGRRPSGSASASARRACPTTIVTREPFSQLLAAGRVLVEHDAVLVGVRGRLLAHADLEARCRAARIVPGPPAGRARRARRPPAAPWPRRSSPRCPCRPCRRAAGVWRSTVPGILGRWTPPRDASTVSPAASSLLRAASSSPPVTSGTVDLLGPAGDDQHHRAALLQLGVLLRRGADHAPCVHAVGRLACARRS